MNYKASPFNEAGERTFEFISARRYLDQLPKRTHYSGPYEDAEIKYNPTNVHAIPNRVNCIINRDLDNLEDAIDFISKHSLRKDFFIIPEMQIPEFCLVLSEALQILPDAIPSNCSQILIIFINLWYFADHETENQSLFEEYILDSIIPYLSLVQFPSIVELAYHALTNYAASSTENCFKIMNHSIIQYIDPFIAVETNEAFYVIKLVRILIMNLPSEFHELFADTIPFLFRFLCSRFPICRDEASHCILQLLYTETGHRIITGNDQCILEAFRGLILLRYQQIEPLMSILYILYDSGFKDYFFNQNSCMEGEEFPNLIVKCMDRNKITLKDTPSYVNFVHDYMCDFWLIYYNLELFKCLMKKANDEKNNSAVEIVNIAYIIAQFCLYASKECIEEVALADNGIGLICTYIQSCEEYQLNTFIQAIHLLCSINDCYIEIAINHEILENLHGINTDNDETRGMIELFIQDVSKFVD